jgi:hypothetical protein
LSNSKGLQKLLEQHLPRVRRRLMSW